MMQRWVKSKTFLRIFRRNLRDSWKDFKQFHKDFRMFKESSTVPDINNPRIMWYPYVLSYETCEGTFQAEIYATSPSHAEMICSELRETAKIVGQKIGEINFG